MRMGKNSPPPDWREVARPTPVFRFVTAISDSTPRQDWFLSDQAAAALRGEEPRRNRVEKEHSELLEGMSVFRTKEDAQAEWDAVSQKATQKGEPMQLPDSIAEVMLAPGCGVSIDDRGEPDGHLYAKGAPEAFVPLVADVRAGEDPAVRLYP